MNFLTIFLTGLLTGGLTCLAVQGGLLALSLAQSPERNKLLSLLFFLFSKLIAYTILGLLLGLFGSLFQFSITISVTLQILVSLYMIATAFSILEIHPIFRYFLIQPPRFITRFIRGKAKSQNIFTPLFLGAFTIFLPCGTTQAMIALAIGSGNPVTSALIMFSFILGTTPLFFILGFSAVKLGESINRNFMKAAAGVIILLAVFNIESAIELTGSSFTLGNLWEELYCTVSICQKNKGIGNATSPVQETTIIIGDFGYQPVDITVKTGSSITLILDNQSRGGCQQAFTIPKLGIQKIIPPGKTDVIKFTAPAQPQTLAFMYSMGMFKGKINVI